MVRGSKEKIWNPQKGLTLVEVATAISVFALIALAVSMSLMRGMEHRRQSFQEFLARNALRDLVAEVQETANQPQDLPNQVGIGAIHSRYHSQTRTVAELPSGQISITCFANEATIPSVLGGPQDLNFDGDPLDDLTAASDDLKLVPMMLTVTFSEGSKAHTITMHRLITKTTD